VSASVFKGGEVRTYLDALDASSVDYLEIGAPSAVFLLDDPSFLGRLVARLKRARVRLRSVHVPYGRAVDISQVETEARADALAAAQTHLRLAAETGARLVVIHPSYEPIAEQERPARLEACRHSLDVLAGNAATLGVQLAVECLPRTCLANTAEETLTIVDGLDPAAVGVCVDVNHLNLREPDIGAAVRRLGHRLLTVHCSDNDGVDERHWLPGHPGGGVDWPASVAALGAVRYRGPFLYEVRSPADDPAAALAAIMSNYQAIIAPLYQ